MAFWKENINFFLDILYLLRYNGNLIKNSISRKSSLMQRDAPEFIRVWSGWGYEVLLLLFQVAASTDLRYRFRMFRMHDPQWNNIRIILTGARYPVINAFYLSGRVATESRTEASKFAFFMSARTPTVALPMAVTRTDVLVLLLHWSQSFQGIYGHGYL